MAVNRVESNRVESIRWWKRKGTKNFLPKKRNRTSYLLFLFSFFFFRRCASSIIKYRSSPPRDAIRAREISSSLSKEWKTRARVRYFLRPRNANYHGEENGEIRIVSGARGGEKTWRCGWKKEAGYRCSVPRNIRVHARFFPWATQKSRRVACTGEGFVAIVRGTTTVWLKRDSSRWIAGREYTRLCAPRIRQDYSHMRRENLANTSVKTFPVPPPSLFLFFSPNRPAKAAAISQLAPARTRMRPPLVTPHPSIPSISSKRSPAILL